MISEAHSKGKISAFVKEYRVEINFVVIFILGVLLAFFAVNNKWAGDNITYPITVAETFVASKVLNVVGYPNTQKGNKLAGAEGNPWRMEVRNNCNGVFESIIFLMAFVAIQLPWRKKIGWMAFGFFLFHIINEMRLISLFIIGTDYSQKTFDFFHETFWQYTLILFTLAIFIFCAQRLSKTPQVEEKKSEA
ncbi:MAG: archaeosortase/exosortase family protein [Acidobacteria bacterium]|nr:archaeosortase/exosortase family protein [Acidobacteriota bacterium]MCB9398340.1 archaeosortase/exosortase family protein [Acidobacteriota bacterium]